MLDPFEHSFSLTRGSIIVNVSINQGKEQSRVNTIRCSKPCVENKQSDDYIEARILSRQECCEDSVIGAVTSGTHFC